MKIPLATTLDQIPELARQTAKSLKGGEVFALVGPLGAGKTAFVKTLGKELKIRHKITSPTFSLMHVFPVVFKNNLRPLTLYHLDLYRIKNFREVRALGIQEFWGHPQTITFIEWADKIKRHLPKKTQTINFVGHE